VLVRVETGERFDAVPLEHAENGKKPTQRYEDYLGPETCRVIDFTWHL